ncbi:rhodanese-related sulfurtransferase [Pigmentiphaga soli]|uniref:Rhodanese-related sulfurtransferase n=1 Tax=Pigmentiphaga soli TaxID=1007095 RepID=A0ABP8GKW1_9BURK
MPVDLLAGSPPVPTLTPRALAARLREPGELALLDVGEEGQFGLGHLLRAVNVPYSLLELQTPVLVPRRGCPVVLVDHGGGIAALAARRLRARGYADVAVLEGGTEAWAHAGYELFQGVYVPSKAFGEWVEHAFGTPSITAPELQRLLQDKADVCVLDPRTVAEHAARHVPGAISCPSAELAYRFEDLVPSPATLVVVACGGRTRGIVGAQSLISAGVPNRVVALADGNHGWQLAGFSLEEGLQRGYAQATPQARQAAADRAQRMIGACGLPMADLNTVRRWLADETRTTFVLDVRTAEEFCAGHVPGARHAPGGQLLQATDKWLGTLGARVVLADSNGVRAAVTGRWLRCMGWEVHVLVHGDIAGDAADTARQALDRTRGANADEAARVVAELAAWEPPVAQIEPDEAARAIAAGAAAVSFDRSADYLAGHPPGALWANRARLDEPVRLLRAGRELVLFSEDGRAADLAAIDLREAAPRPDEQVKVVRGGLKAWRQAGYEVQAARPDCLPASERIDVLYWMHDRRAGNKDAMRGYLDWERGLLAQMARDGFAFAAPQDAGSN